ncbi:MAG: hypothetical protein JXQ84_05240 [Rhodospirillaceae bacterium]|nr:hypothetical protein [Rhodospirillaceae bacterium]
MSGDYSLCGWRVHSTLSLPELLPWVGPCDADVDVAFADEAIDADLVAAARGRYLYVTDDGAVLLQLPGRFRILTRGGVRVSVDADPLGAASGWRPFVLGAGLYHLCHQRNLFPLHAACLRIGERVVAIAGHSGMGKSTLAAVLNRRGHGLLSDDTVVLDVNSADGVTLLPSFPRLRLWQDVVKALDLTACPAIPVREGLAKYALEIGGGFDPAPMRLDAVILLEEGDGPVLHDVAPTAAVPLLQAYVHRPRLIELLGRQAAVFAQSAAIAGRVRVLRLERPLRFDVLEAVAALIESAFSS